MKTETTKTLSSIDLIKKEAEIVMHLSECHTHNEAISNAQNGLTRSLTTAVALIKDTFKPKQINKKLAQRLASESVVEYVKEQFRMLAISMDIKAKNKEATAVFDAFFDPYKDGDKTYKKFCTFANCDSKKQAFEKRAYLKGPLEFFKDHMETIAIPNATKFKKELYKLLGIEDKPKQKKEDAPVSTDAIGSALNVPSNDKTVKQTTTTTPAPTIPTPPKKVAINREFLTSYFSQGIDHVEKSALGKRQQEEVQKRLQEILLVIDPQK